MFDVVFAEFTMQQAATLRRESYTYKECTYNKPIMRHAINHW